MSTLALGVGFLMALLVILRFRSKRLEKTKWAYPLLLASFPIYYWAFAIFAKDFPALINEILVGLIFLLVAYVAYRFKSFVTMIILGIGFIAHALYDFKHTILFNNPGTPAWWPEFCGSVDVLIGLYVLYLALSLRVR